MYFIDVLGKYTYENGNSYEGEWDKEKKHGYGKYIYKITGTRKIEATRKLDQW